MPVLANAQNLMYLQKSVYDPLFKSWVKDAQAIDESALGQCTSQTATGSIAGVQPGQDLKVLYTDEAHYVRLATKLRPMLNDLRVGASIAEIQNTAYKA